ncbi:MAG: DegT/DnrJ/EryC1/StrS family aminotransferase [Bacteroidota bacterium]
MIPFSPPRIDQKIIDEVVKALQSGWITTGPRTKRFEQEISTYCGSQKTLCLNSATAGLELMLRWFGVGEGDEVILPAYTYSATANVVMHCGAKPVLADVRADDFNIDIAAVRNLISPSTKVIMPVDIAGFPCDYDALNRLIREEQVRKIFKPANTIQEQFGRILLLSDAAHSLGATYKGRRTGTLADATVFSFHAVKNLTTAEGGAVTLMLPEAFDDEAVYKELNIKALHGQNKDALAKTQKGNWEYDIIEPGYKWNMPDILAAIGLIELERYDSDTLLVRKAIVEQYLADFATYAWAQLPVANTDQAESCYHLFMLRIRDVSEQQRNQIIQKIFDYDVSVNVHFKPLPLLSYYKSMGYRMEDYPVAYDNYSREISLPVYYGLEPNQVKLVSGAVIQAVEEVLNQHHV